MKFTLKDYQDEAVKEVLDRFKKARKRWHEDDDKHAFSLTATTGAGKTVMAAAVFEALFHGNDDYNFEPDRGAVVIWFSDDPSLNEQSRWRLQEASDKLTISDLVSVGNTFGREKFEAGKIYFLNTQKLSKNSLLVRGHDSDDAAIEKDDRQMRIMPDLRSHTIWDTIQNTIEDPDLTLYLVLDEAHRGMQEGKRSNGDGKPTIVKQLINGSGSVPGIPIVWGISATVQRFNDAVSGMQGRGTLSNVVVDSAKVQDSGLLKDTIDLDIPDDTGNEFKACGRHPIERVEGARTIHDVDARVALHLTCVKFGVYSASYLIKLTHQEPAWDKAYKLERNSEVEFKEMVQNFKDRWIDELELEDDYDDAMVARLHSACESAKNGPKLTAEELMDKLSL